MSAFRHLARDLGGLAAVAGLLLLVTFLPPDTSLDEVRKNKAIRVCVPASYPPLVTGDPSRPGVDIEILRAVTAEMGVELQLRPVAAMGRDFNPRNWGINRARCQLLAGGVVDSRLTRSFLDTGPPYAGTGWAVVAPAPLAAIDGRSVGALVLVSGLDRIGLASYLRAHDAKVRVVTDAGMLVEGLAGGVFEAGVTESLLAGGLAADNGLWAAAMPQDLERYNLVFGLWKGDLTLKRGIVKAFRQVESEGRLAEILTRYGVTELPELGRITTN